MSLRIVGFVALMVRILMSFYNNNYIKEFSMNSFFSEITIDYTMQSYYISVKIFLFFLCMIFYLLCKKLLK